MQKNGGKNYTQCAIPHRQNFLAFYTSGAGAAGAETNREKNTKVSENGRNCHFHNSLQLGLILFAVFLILCWAYCFQYEILITRYPIILSFRDWTGHWKRPFRVPGSHQGLHPVYWILTLNILGNPLWCLNTRHCTPYIEYWIWISLKIHFEYQALQRSYCEEAGWWL